MKIIRASLVCAFLLCVGCGCNPCFSQSVAEFKAASESTNCDLIPYPSVRKDCDDAQKEVVEYCKSSDRKWKCDQDLDRKNKEEIKKKIENGEACLSRREKIAAIFERARDTLRNETDEEKKKYAEICIRKIEQNDHKQARDEAKTAVFNCKQLYNP